EEICNGGNSFPVAMSERPVIYYVSGHGLGHASRACQVIKALPAHQPVIVKSMAPADFFRRESGRPDLAVVPKRFDIGAVQKSNREIDWGQTLAQAGELLEQSEAIAQDEAKYLLKVNAAGVVCDVPPLPLYAASLAGIPACLVANFTWVDIYKSPSLDATGGE